MLGRSGASSTLREGGRGGGPLGWPVPKPKAGLVAVCVLVRASAPRGVIAGGAAGCDLAGASTTRAGGSVADNVAVATRGASACADTVVGALARPRLTSASSGARLGASTGAGFARAACNVGISVSARNRPPSTALGTMGQETTAALEARVCGKPHSSGRTAPSRNFCAWSAEGRNVPGVGVADAGTEQAAVGNKGCLPWAREPPSPDS